MKLVQALLIVVICGEAACGSRDADNSASNGAVAAPQPPAGPASPAPPKPTVSNQTAEPNGPIDPTSTEAAGQVVQNYGALVEQQRWKEANELWGDPATAAKMEAALQAYPVVHLEIGNLGHTEGAAGSIYVTMPVILYGDDKAGQPFRYPAEAVLRRANDVPGSTEAQRRWHIERIDWGS